MHPAFARFSRVIVLLRRVDGKGKFSRFRIDDHLFAARDITIISVFRYGFRFIHGKIALSRPLPYLPHAVLLGIDGPAVIDITEILSAGRVAHAHDPDPVRELSVGKKAVFLFLGNGRNAFAFRNGFFRAFRAVRIAVRTRIFPVRATDRGRYGKQRR